MKYVKLVRYVLILTLLSCTLTFAHDKSEVQKRQMYEVIQSQLDKGEIDIQTAQKMWKAYIKCCG